MLHSTGGRTATCLAHVLAGLMACALSASAAWAQAGEPIKIGYGISQTGGLAPNGKSALLAQQIWEEDVNAKGGLLGRPVKLVYYDDQTNPATVPGIYKKLLDVDKVDIVIGGYGTNLLAPAMPVVIQKKKMLIGLFGLAVNTEFNYPKYFSMIPSGPDPEDRDDQGFLRNRHGAEPEAADGRDRGGRCGILPSTAPKARARTSRRPASRSSTTRRYPPATTDFAPIVRAIQATNPDIVAIFSYPPDSVGMVRAVNEIGYKPKMIGGGMVGLQATAIKTQLGPLLNGFVNYDFWLPMAKLEFPRRGGVHEEVSGQGGAGRRRSARLLHRRPGATPSCRCWQQAIEATKSLDDDKLADYIRAYTFKTLVGDVTFGAQGEWAESRVLQVQFQHVKGNDVGQFKDVSTQVVITPAQYKSGEVIYPYEKAK